MVKNCNICPYWLCTVPAENCMQWHHYYIPQLAATWNDAMLEIASLFTVCKQGLKEQRINKVSTV